MLLLVLYRLLYIYYYNFAFIIVIVIYVILLNKVTSGVTVRQWAVWFLENLLVSTSKIYVVDTLLYAVCYSLL